jgi:uncharacterized protein
MKALKYLFATIIVLCIVFVAGAFALINYALSTSDRNRTLSYEYMERTYPETRPWMDSLNAIHALRDTFVVLSTGNRQHAIFVANPKAHGRTALLVHGYECDAAKMIHIARLYERVLGYNVLISDLYGHGLVSVLSATPSLSISADTPSSFSSELLPKMVVVCSGRALLYVS